MADLPKPSAVVFAKDVARVAAFYEQVARLAVVHADADHMVLDGERSQLVVHAIPAHIAARIEITAPPEVREGMPVKLCLPVPSLAAARAAAARLGGALEAKEEEWQARGFRACDGYDPEGNVVQFRESAA